MAILTTCPNIALKLSMVALRMSKYNVGNFHGHFVNMDYYGLQTPIFAKNIVNVRQLGFFFKISCG